MEQPGAAVRHALALDPCPNVTLGLACAAAQSEEAIEKFKTAIAPRWLGNIAKFLSENTESAFSTGASVTIADYLLYDALDVARTLVPSSLDAYPRLQEFISAFEARDGIKEYLASERLQGVPPL